jgi:hypothetical protein
VSKGIKTIEKIRSIPKAKGGGKEEWDVGRWCTCTTDPGGVIMEVVKRVVEHVIEFDKGLNNHRWKGTWWLCV